jgi:hypothetical protein
MYNRSSNQRHLCQNSNWPLTQPKAELIPEWYHNLVRNMERDPMCGVTVNERDRSADRHHETELSDKGGPSSLER